MLWEWLLQRLRATATFDGIKTQQLLAGLIVFLADHSRSNGLIRGFID